MSDSGSAAPETAPIESDEFSRLMAAVGPFERRPALAVAVSGGADSMALVLLADRWVRGCGGALTALTVDHRLRPESGREAAEVARWLAGRGIAHRVLAWADARGGADLQARARAARHGLLQDWCAGAGVLHLLLAHHQDDQAETVLLRLGRGSGVDGLGAMAPVAYGRTCRLVRPLLDLPKARLVATCGAFGQPVIDDPSNRDSGFARVRLRQARPALEADGLTARRLAATAAAMRRARAALEQATAELLVHAARPHPGGFCRLERAALLGAPRELALRGLAAVLGCVGGAGYRPRLERLTRLLEAIAGAAPAARTLGGCRVVVRADTVWIAREAAAMAPPVALAVDRGVTWDRRFVVYAAGPLPRGATIGGLGAAGLAALRADLRAGGQPGGRRGDRLAVPTIGLPGLPTIRDLDGVLAVPHLNYCRRGHRTDTITRVSILPDPVAALVGAGGATEPGWFDVGR